MDSTMCVVTRVCMSFGRERKGSALSGSKHPQRGPAFQLCDSLSPHRHTLVISIPLQACGIKGNRLHMLDPTAGACFIEGHLTAPKHHKQKNANSSAQKESQTDGLYHPTKD